MSNNLPTTIELHIKDGDLFGILTRGQWLMNRAGSYKTYCRDYRADVTDGVSPLLYRLLCRLETALTVDGHPLLYMLAEVHDIHADEDDEDNEELSGICDITAVCKHIIRCYMLANKALTDAA